MCQESRFCSFWLFDWANFKYVAIVFKFCNYLRKKILTKAFQLNAPQLMVKFIEAGQVLYFKWVVLQFQK